MIVCTVCAGLLTLSGLALRAYTVCTTPKGTSGRNTARQVADHLNTKGIYSVVRHPLYLANYLIWAGILLLLILWEKFVLSHSETLSLIFGHIHVWLIIPLTWIIFALRDLGDLRSYFCRLIGLTLPGCVINSSDISRVFADGWIYIVLGLVCLLPGVRRAFNRLRFGAVWTILLFIMFWLSVYSLSGAMTNPFMYMSF